MSSDISSYSSQLHQPRIQLNSEPEMARFLLPPSPHSSIMFQLAIAVILLWHSNQMIAMALPAENNIQLIEKVCTESLEPQVCSKCVTSDHSRQFDDLPGFIYSLLNCMLSKTTTANDIAGSLAQKGASPSLKSTLSVCTSAFNDAIKQLQLAMLSMAGSHYTEAWNYSTEARRMVFRCSLAFHSDADFTIPSSLLDPMVNARQLCDAAYLLFVLILG